jgi:hypothetical protein
MPTDETKQNRKSSRSDQPWSEKLKDLATAAGAISAAFGIAFSSWTYVDTQWKKNDEAQIPIRTSSFVPRLALSTGLYSTFVGNFPKLWSWRALLVLAH